jgi:GT2 family glycosyltransferase
VSPGEDPRVSVVVLAHRGSAALAKAVRSVVEQDHRPLELVIFENGSTTRVPEIPGDAGVELVRGESEVNLGVAGGRDAAARLACGELLLFLDDDAVLAPGAIGRALDAMRAPEVGAVAFNVRDPVTRAPALWYHPYAPDDWSGRPFEASSIIGCGSMIRRSCFEALGGFWDGYFREAEEFDFSWRLIDAGWTIRYAPDAVVEHPERSEPHFRFSVSSNLLMVWRLMPLPLALRQTAFLVALFSARALRNGQLRELAAALALAGRAAPRALRDRTPLKPGTVDYLRRVHAPQGLGKRLRWSLRPLEAPAPLGGQPAAVR